MASIKYSALFFLLALSATMAAPQFGLYGGGSNAYSHSLGLGGSFNLGPIGFSGSLAESNAYANSYGHGLYGAGPGYYGGGYGPYYGGYGLPFGGFF